MHSEIHKSHRAGWLRAAVLGANDGLVSTASLIIGVAAAGSSHDVILLSGVAGLVAGSMSMAAGEYVSVSSQADTEAADLKMEQESLNNDIEGETQELAQIYQARGLEPKLANQVAQALMEHDALGAHARDDIGITDVNRANPLQAAFYSACTFLIGAGVPLIAIWFIELDRVILTTTLVSILFLGILGGLAAYLGGACIAKGAMRVVSWGCLAMLATAIVGSVFDVMV
ncbi:VIT family protein [Catenovulum sp. SM1970]|uniref:VIT1/CCC1 transporter family protein n=1 Tax=Marinifaba aquimaris TaxID=2741323 RepID=UPI001573703D|nr:VIT family protein [Marinifaba aquimaris]NTS75422.1 VIT family protein [Marinifaba aquimaris]